MHDHGGTGPMLVVPLTDEYMRFTRPNGQTVEIRRKAGEPLWFQDSLPMPAHAAENLAGRPAEQLWIELKVKR